MRDRKGRISSTVECDAPFFPSYFLSVLSCGIVSCMGSSLEEELWRTSAAWTAYARVINILPRLSSRLLRLLCRVSILRRDSTELVPLGFSTWFIKCKRNYAEVLISVSNIKNSPFSLFHLNPSERNAAASDIICFHCERFVTLRIKCYSNSRAI